MLQVGEGEAPHLDAAVHQEHVVLRLACWQAQLGDAEVIAIQRAVRWDLGVGLDLVLAGVHDHHGRRTDSSSCREGAADRGLGHRQAGAGVGVAAVHCDVEGACDRVRVADPSACRDRARGPLEACRDRDVRSQDHAGCSGWHPDQAAQLDVCLVACAVSSEPWHRVLSTLRCVHIHGRHPRQGDAGGELDPARGHGQAVVGVQGLGLDAYVGTVVPVEACGDAVVGRVAAVGVAPVRDPESVDVADLQRHRCAAVG